MRRMFVGTLLALAIACASMPAKQRATISLQAVETALGNAQDFERANWQLLGEDKTAPENVRHYCPDGTLPSPLPQDANVHQVISCLFVIAFNEQMESSRALLNWNAGTPPPSQLGMLRGVVDLIFDIVRGFTPTAQQQQMVQLAKTTVDNVLIVVQAVGGNVPSLKPGGVQ